MSQKEKIELIHIYYGTSGVSGSYLHEIYSAIEKIIKQEVIVSYYYPFNYGIKIGFKITDLGNTNFLTKNKILRLLVRYLELNIFLLRSLYYILKEKPKTVNYSVTRSLNVEYYFLYLVKNIIGTNLLITCHDAEPFYNKYVKRKKILKYVNKIYNLADKLVVHNSYSLETIHIQSNIPIAKFIKHSFPPMNFYNKNKATKQNKYLFVGNMRREKGINILLAAWLRYKSDYQTNDEIIVAGNNPGLIKVELTSELREKNNITLIQKYISDIEYQTILAKAQYIILPYTAGTNSGIPLQAISVGTVPLVSSLTFFKEQIKLSEECYFEANSIDSLYDKFVYLMNNEINISQLEEKLIQYKKKFKADVSEVYKVVSVAHQGLNMSVL